MEFCTWQKDIFWDLAVISVVKFLSDWQIHFMLAASS